MEIKELYKLFKKNPIICIDSRKAEKKSIFFALKGDNFDGNKFADTALELGCAYAVIDNKKYNKKNDERYILVENVLSCLQQLASFHRNNIDVKIIALTGSNGKTTTKELIAEVLKQQFKVNYTQGNLNNHIGVPLTLLSMESKHEYGIVEMGANHIGEIKELCSIAQPDFGIITNIGKAHIEGFGSFEGVIQAKTEMYEYINSKKGSVFIHQDNEILRNAIINYPDIELIKYGSSEELFLKGRIKTGVPFLECELEIANEIIDVTTQLVGDYNLENVLAAVSVGLRFGVSVELIKKALEKYKPTNNRSQLVKTHRNVLILDLYNANPSSMEVALKNFENIKGKTKIVILGDMLELGKESTNEHKNILELVKSGNCKIAFFIGKEFKKNIKKLPIANMCFDDSESFRNWLIRYPIKESHILIKGSRGIHLEKVVEVL